ncbi:putative membrane protein [Dysgonomonas sp. PFB1-18]|uniref:hypothetical protein n=1 Tax=unclassified Dysgonomonas TaxID=2630389 RepID=UPI0024733CF6|nr:MULTISPECIES: hypothetical protein [unclassified Dysgonomonas]MDL2303703.1 hypothetical protein [Dysgonomonas sp. OttesenSCG-928-D17]MDH6308577.1 putative membrane protein [Dysgonomonas sp. PF1-14]MDH6338078.1 putative membrane protein [Dysgonomonas sp. PF1-16]MDH6379575.1 putative membrane protein [Dysgonomonas sp. PFB1-18]MDH6396905.1 putative membrane protein [Dysgonomonas sp. PF1-23]
MAESNFDIIFWINVIAFIFINSLPVLAVIGLAVSAYFKKKKLVIAFIVAIVVLLLYYWLESDPYDFVLPF